jgi:hypothetical protein
MTAPTPTQSDLPTTRALVRATLIALTVAAAVLFTVVLPAEYGIDPTRIGRALGLTQMGEIKVRLAREAAADAAEDAAAMEAAEAATDSTPRPASADTTS